MMRVKNFLCGLFPTNDGIEKLNTPSTLSLVSVINGSTAVKDYRMVNIDTVMEVINKILDTEGQGDNPQDKAPATNWGITLPVYEEYSRKITGNPKYKATKAELDALPRIGAASVYRWWFNKYNLQLIQHPDLMYLVFDASVNHGASRAIKWLQLLAGTNPDGVLGVITAAAVNKNPIEIYYKYVAKRIVFYGHIVQERPDDYLWALEGWLIRGTEFIKEIKNV